MIKIYPTVDVSGKEIVSMFQGCAYALTVFTCTYHLRLVLIGAGFVHLSVFFFQAEIKIFNFSLVDFKMKIFKLGE